MTMGEVTSATTQVPLSLVRPGTAVTVVGIRGGHGLTRRLSAMCLVPGAQIEIVRVQFGGPLVVRVMGGKIMLGRGMTHRILVDAGGTC